MFARTVMELTGWPIRKRLIDLVVNNFVFRFKYNGS